MPGCTLLPEDTPDSNRAAELAGELAQQLAEVAGPGAVSQRIWGEPCTAGEDRVTVHVTLTKALPADAVPDTAAAHDLADELQARADELGLALGDPGHRAEFQEPFAHVLELYSYDRRDSPRATVTVPVFDDLGAADEPLLRIDAEVPCAQASGEPLVGQEPEATRQQALAEARRALDALAPVLATAPTAEEPTCVRAGEQSGNAVFTLRLRPEVPLQEVRAMLDRVWPTSDGWRHYRRLAEDESLPRLQYRREPLNAALRSIRPGEDPTQLRLDVGTVCF